jgi:GntR family transcriptional regulator
VVATIPDSSRKERAELLGQEIEELVVEAKRLGLSTEEVIGALRAHWERLSRNGAEGVGEVGTKEGGRKR